MAMEGRRLRAICHLLGTGGSTLPFWHHSWYINKGYLGMSDLTVKETAIKFDHSEQSVKRSLKSGKLMGYHKTNKW